MCIIPPDVVNNCTITAFFATIKFNIEPAVPGEMGEEH